MLEMPTRPIGPEHRPRHAAPEAYPSVEVLPDRWERLTADPDHGRWTREDVALVALRVIAAPAILGATAGWVGGYVWDIWTVMGS